VKPLLRFDAVSCRRGGRLLFDNLDLALGPGEALHVKGPNGSGKSSLIRLAAGLLQPLSGIVERSSAGIADEHLALDRELALREAMSFWGGEFEGAMRAFGLLPLAEVPVRLLSAGQAKRAALARAAASAAPLWLLDEPANGLDKGSVDLLANAIERHRASGGAVVAASHLPLPADWQTLELGG